MSKFFNERCTYDRRSFASKGERDCYQLLKFREMAGEISIITCQEQVYLTKARIIYKPDFTIRELATGETIWVEYKGFETPEWRLKKRLWREYGPGKLLIYKGTGLRMRIDEEIIPPCDSQKMP